MIRLRRSIQAKVLRRPELGGEDDLTCVLLKVAYHVIDRFEYRAMLPILNSQILDQALRIKLVNDANCQFNGVIKPLK